MRYWNFLRNPNFKVFPIQLLLVIIIFLLGEFLCSFWPSGNLVMIILILSYLLILTGVVNLLFYLKNILTGNKKSGLISSGQFIIAALILVGITYMLMPKTSRSGGVCRGCEIEECNCLGFEHFNRGVPGTTSCFGIVYNCTTTMSWGE